LLPSDQRPDQPEQEQQPTSKPREAASAPVGPRELWQTVRACQWRAPDGNVLNYAQGDYEVFPAGTELPPYWRKIADNPAGYDKIRAGLGLLRAAVLGGYSTDSFGAQSLKSCRRLDGGDELRARAQLRRERMQDRLDNPLDY
jgi:hypothetical protein